MRILRLLPGTFSCPPCPDVDDGIEVFGSSVLSDTILMPPQWFDIQARLAEADVRSTMKIVEALYDDIRPLPEDAIDRINNPPSEEQE